jgi:hypothetical protein
MVSEDVILQKYCTKGISKGGELLLCHTDALNLIEDCRGLGVVILGLDFYIQTNQGIFEVSSADYSDISRQLDAVEKTTKAANLLIQEMLPDGANWVSFVLSSQ